MESLYRISKTAFADPDTHVSDELVDSARTDGGVLPGPPAMRSKRQSVLDAVLPMRSIAVRQVRRAGHAKPAIASSVPDMQNRQFSFAGFWPSYSHRLTADGSRLSISRLTRGQARRRTCKTGGRGIARTFPSRGTRAWHLARPLESRIPELLVLHVRHRRSRPEAAPLGLWHLNALTSRRRDAIFGTAGRSEPCRKKR